VVAPLGSPVPLSCAVVLVISVDDTVTMTWGATAS
jgi:hypothetical protein